MCQSLRLRQLARERQAFFHAIQGLVGPAEKPECPRGETRHCHAWIKCIKKGVVTMLSGIVECECFLIVIECQFEISQVRESDLERPVAAHRKSRIRKS